MSNNPIKRILILGGGFAGVYAAMTLATALEVATIDSPGVKVNGRPTLHRRGLW
jgi:NADH dehydrogenase FAD-containing subunit